jgi:hypothetical protein
MIPACKYQREEDHEFKASWAKLDLFQSQTQIVGPVFKFIWSNAFLACMKPWVLSQYLKANKTFLARDVAPQ